MAVALEGNMVRAAACRERHRLVSTSMRILTHLRMPKEAWEHAAFVARECVDAISRAISSGNTEAVVRATEDPSGWFVAALMVPCEGHDGRVAFGALALVTVGGVMRACAESAAARGEGVSRWPFQGWCSCVRPRVHRGTDWAKFDVDTTRFSAAARAAVVSTWGACACACSDACGSFSAPADGPPEPFGGRTPVTVTCGLASVVWATHVRAGCLYVALENILLEDASAGAPLALDAAFAACVSRADQRKVDAEQRSCLAPPQEPPVCSSVLQDVTDTEEWKVAMHSFVSHLRPGAGGGGERHRRRKRKRRPHVAAPALAPDDGGSIVLHVV